ncbi:hypothetical protein [Methylobacterium sp. J-077]|uniref:hypothetical protein n=1 Tax=Methylobacterium sp. J-077 TaxID=2836656 RepID=UPI001FB9F247|nr:hypothetical protein [Methylobacterium sp. J-077]MCJ2123391.1 hypothetical protein [Methylobacterium sp. J-077]
MHWAAVILTAYAAGLVEFWRLCRDAPLMPDEAARPYQVELESAEQPRHHPA